MRAYVALELARFPDFLHVEYDIDSMFLMVPPLTLQPLVENAIVHGIKEKSRDGHVLIYNINRRMKRLYNTELHLKNRPGGGTDTYIVVPKEGEACCEP